MGISGDLKGFRILGLGWMAMVSEFSGGELPALAQGLREACGGRLGGISGPCQADGGENYQPGNPYNCMY